VRVGQNAESNGVIRRGKVRQNVIGANFYSQ